MVHQKIIEVMKAVSYLKKDDTISVSKYNTYKAISEEKVTTAVREQLIEQGLTIYPIKMEHTRSDYETVNAEGKRSVMHLATVDVTYRVTAIEDGSHVDVVSSGTGVDSQDKAVGKAMTYAYKYLMLRLFAIPTGEDPDKIASAKLDNDFGSPRLGQDEKLISQDQVKHLLDLAANKGYSKKQIEKSISKTYHVNIHQLTTQEYNEVVNRLA